MSRFTLSLLVQVALCGAAAKWLKSSRIEFPSAQIAAVESPFEKFNPTTHSRNMELASFSNQAYPVVKFPQRDMIKALPTKEKGEFDSIVHFPPKRRVEDPRGNKSPITERPKRTKSKTRRTKVQSVNKEIGCGGRSIARRTKTCRKTRKRVILRPLYTIFG